MSCIDLDTMEQMLGRALPGQAEAQVQEHLDRCASCFELMRAAIGRKESLALASTSAEVPDPLQQPAAPAAPGSWRPPQSFDEFRVLRPLGHGAMGQVYLARDTHLDREVAVKFSTSQDLSQGQRQRFLREARALARLSHPSVVAAYRYGEVEGRPFLVSEFIRGQGLHKLPRPAPSRQALRLAIGLARGLSAAHSSGVLHRDIKPANVILAQSGEVKLLDFGLAKRFGSPDPIPEPDGAESGGAQTGGAESGGAQTGGAESGDQHPALTQTGALLGTPLYMSPESWRGEQASPQADVYSLGAVVYELLSGRTPHHGRTLRELRQAVLETDAPPLAGLVPGVDPGLAAVVERCLQRDPAARYASGVELCAALEALENQAAPARRRRPLRWAGIALGLGALLAGPLYLWQRWTASNTRGALAQPADAQARQRYGEGLALLLVHDYAAALPLLDQAAAREQAFPPVHAALAEALIGVNDLDRARQEARRAMDLSQGRSRRQRLYCEGLYHEANQELDQAVEAYRALFLLSKSNLEYGLKLATAQMNRSPGTRNERGIHRDALATLAALRELPSAQREDPRMDIMEAWAQTDPRAAIAAAERAVRLAQAQGAAQLVAEARNRQADAYLQLGDVQQAVAAAMEAQRIYKLGRRWFVLSRLQFAIGDALTREGDDVAAADVYREMIASARQMPAGARERTLMLGLPDLARSLRELGRLKEAQGATEEVMALELADSQRRGFTHQRSAYILIRVRTEQGDLAGAHRLYDEAMAQLTAEDPTVTDEERIDLYMAQGAVLLAQGDLAAARVRAQDAQALLRPPHNSSQRMDSVHRHLMRVALAEGRLAEAEAEARLILAGLTKERWRYRDANVEAVLALALLGQGKQAEAEQAIVRARGLLGRGQNVLIRTLVQMAAARVRAATGRRAEVAGALQELGAVAAEARQLGLVGVVLEARLWQGRIALKSGRRAPGAGDPQRELPALAAEAAARGYGWIAAQAQVRGRRTGPDPGRAGL